MPHNDWTYKQEKTIALYLCECIEDLQYSEWEEACHIGDPGFTELVEEWNNKIQEMRDIITRVYRGY